MLVKIRLFANLKDFFKPELVLDLPDDSLARDVIGRLSEINPAGAALLGGCRIAVNDNFVDADYPVNREDEILVMPPFSGG